MCTQLAFVHMSLQSLILLNCRIGMPKNRHCEKALQAAAPEQSQMRNTKTHSDTHSLSAMGARHRTDLIELMCRTLSSHIPAIMISAPPMHCLLLTS